MERFGGVRCTEKAFREFPYVCLLGHRTLPPLAPLYPCYDRFSAERGREEADPFKLSWSIQTILGLFIFRSRLQKIELKENAELQR